MALPRKGTRTITVDGHVLRWMVRPVDDGFRLVAESKEAPGQSLVVRIPRSAFGAALTVVSPEIARQAIVQGFAAGFVPAEARGEVRLTVTELDTTTVDREALTPRPVGRPRKRAPGEKRRPVYVSLDKADRESLEAAARARGLPIGTLARQWLLERLAEE
jgi:hypothetical protein